MMDEHPTSEFEAHREHLLSVAYRMVGSVSEAEDLVQDAYLRWKGVESAQVDDPRAYLTTVVTRLCIDHLRSARVQREEYIGPWLPDPIAGEAAPDRPAELADSLSVAFLVLLEALNPVERAVFLLRDVFGYDYDEIAEMVGKSVVNCRKIASRARKRVMHRPSHFDVPRAKQRELVDRFLRAVDGEDLEGLLDVLTEDVVLYSDGGGQVNAAQRPIRSADHVSRFMLGIRNKVPAGFTVVPQDVNGTPGFMAYVEGSVQSVWSFEVRDGRIARIYVVLNPQKIAHLGSQTDS